MSEIDGLKFSVDTFGDRVVVSYSDGCKTAFPVGQSVTVEQALSNHVNLHPEKTKIERD